MRVTLPGRAGRRRRACREACERGSDAPADGLGGDAQISASPCFEDQRLRDVAIEGEGSGEPRSPTGAAGAVASSRRWRVADRQQKTAALSATKRT